MKKVVLTVLLIYVLILSSCGTPQSVTNEQSPASTSVGEVDTRAADKQDASNEPAVKPGKQDGKDSAKTGKTKEPVEFGIGEAWTVDGQWSLTIDAVTETDYRNQFSDKTPVAVYMIDYTYTNLGYEGTIMDGVYFNLDQASVVDSAGQMGYSYPGRTNKTPKQTPVGATCNAQACIGVDNAGAFTLRLNEYDGNHKKQSAVFRLSAE